MAGMGVHRPVQNGLCPKCEGVTVEHTIRRMTELLAFVRKVAANPCEWGCQPGDDQPCVSCQARRLTES